MDRIEDLEVTRRIKCRCYLSKRSRLNFALMVLAADGNSEGVISLPFDLLRLG